MPFALVKLSVSPAKKPLLIAIVAPDRLVSPFGSVAKRLFSSVTAAPPWVKSAVPAPPLGTGDPKVSTVLVTAGLVIESASVTV